MTTDTVHLVLTWRAGPRGKLKAEPPLKFKTAAEAKARAERAADKFAGVVAISQGFDVDTEQADESPTVLFKAGQVPAEFHE
jgi:hypothetical protein